MKSFNDWKNNDEIDIDEALSIAQRRKRALLIKRMQPKIRRGREIAKRKMASPEVLKKRARKKARLAVFKKLSKGLAPANVGIAMRRTLEDKLKTKSMLINRLAKKLYPKMKKDETHRLKTMRSSSGGETNIKGVEKAKSDTPGQ